MTYKQSKKLHESSVKRMRKAEAILRSVKYTMRELLTAAEEPK